MKSEVDKLTEAPGILAAAKTENGDTQVQSSDGDARKWAALLDAGRHVLDVAATDEVKIALDKFSVVVMRSGTFTLGVVVVKSHPVVKSLKRMLRRAFKRLDSGVSSSPVSSPRILEEGAPVAPVEDDNTTKLPF